MAAAQAQQLVRERARSARVDELLELHDVTRDSRNPFARAQGSLPVSSVDVDLTFLHDLKTNAMSTLP